MEGPKKRVAVVGGGLVGTLHAIYLAKKGFHVRVYESRDDVRVADQTDPMSRSVNLTLSMRGQEALKAVGLESLVLENAVPVHGRMIHELSGFTYSQPYGIGNQCIYSVNRHKLITLLLDKAKEFGDNIEFAFSHKLTRIDFTPAQAPQPASIELTLSRNAKGENIVKKLKEKVEFCFGCDGAFSTVLRQMDHASGINYKQEYTDVYKELIIPPDDRGEPAMKINYLHIWPRDEFILIALPNKNHSFTATLFMPKKRFSTIKDANDLIKFFDTHFRDVIPLIGKEKLAADYFRNNTSNFKSIKCDPHYIEEGALLMGDAAHAMVPFYGQGMNTGFEDCLIFSNLLQQHGNDLHKAAKQYNEERRKDTYAICDLALENYTKLRTHVNSKFYNIERKVDGFLHWLCPGSFMPLYSMVAFSTIPYSTVVERNKKQRQIVQSIFIIASITLLVLIIAVLYEVRFDFV